MGTDWIQLYDKRLSDRILKMNRPTLTRFLEDNIDVLEAKDQAGVTLHSSLVFVMSQNGTPVTKAVEELLAETKLNDFKKQLALDFCLGEETVYLDYWGCHAHVFSGVEPPGSISCGKYFREEECDFLLLTSEHVDRMLKSLYEHSDDLRVMRKETIGRVEYFRDFCRSHSNYWVAYRFDF